MSHRSTWTTETYPNIRRALVLLVASIALLALPVTGVAQPSNPIDLNTATVAQLRTLPGIGPAKAEAIIEWRDANGPFESVDQLTSVPGIGDATLANIRSHVSIGEGAPTAQQTDAPTADEPSAEEQETLDLRETPPPAEAETGDAAPAVDRINLNTASVDALQELPGIGPAKAEAILAWRDANGPFTSVDQLTEVHGIGPATLESLRPLVTVE